jgi:hypothetical protein
MLRFVAVSIRDLNIKRAGKPTNEKVRVKSNRQKKFAPAV